jgi:DNA-binding IclR family transcriptional regulator
VACVNPDGTVTPSAISILTALRSADTAELIAPLAGLPLFRVRSALRELVVAGLVAAENGHYRLTDAGLARL